MSKERNIIIGIDARSLSVEKMGGIGRYLYNVLSGWKIIPDKYKIILYSTKPIIHLPNQLNAEMRITPYSPSTGWMEWILPKQLVEDGVTIFWGPQQVLPPKVKGIKYAITVHDLALLRNPLWGNKLIDYLIQRIITTRSIRTAEAIITVSNATKEDVVKLFEQDEEMPYIRTVYSGGSAKVASINVVDCNIINYKYYLYIGDLNKRKNVDGIVNAFQLYCDVDSEAKLVLAGGNSKDKYEKLLKGLNQRIRNRIILPGYISDEEKQSLLKNALALVFPSRYEGFGLPILEAMENDCLVITARTSCLEEIAGESALYVENPDDTEGLADLMQKVSLMDSDERARRVEAGKNRALDFSWEECARKTWETLLECGE